MLCVAIVEGDEDVWSCEEMEELERERLGDVCVAVER